MFTGPVGPVEVFFYWPEAVIGNFYWPGAIGLPLASSPELGQQHVSTLCVSTSLVESCIACLNLIIYLCVDCIFPRLVMYHSLKAVRMAGI